jgi:hypothetical protein
MCAAKIHRASMLLVSNDILAGDLHESSLHLLEQVKTGLILLHAY